MYTLLEQAITAAQKLAYSLNKIIYVVAEGAEWSCVEVLREKEFPNYTADPEKL